MADFTIDAFTFTTTSSGSVVLTGLGVLRPIDIGNVNSLSASSLNSASTNPNLTPEARDALREIAQDPEAITSIKTALSPPPPAPVAPPPTTEQQITQQNTQYINSGAADDDNPTIQRYDDGSSIQTFDDGSTLVTDSEGNVTSTDAPPDQTVSGTTVAGKSNTSTAKKKRRPTRRLKNPLGDFSSYTYQISLYMVTPEAYNAFITSGRKNINAIGETGGPEGVYLVAQSGGIDSTTGKRAPGFELDYYIENLEINAAVAMGKSEDASGPANETTIKFQIIEPYGFSFISKLKQMQNELQSYVKSLPGAETSPFADRQFYIIGIRFFGYDAAGNLINGLGQVSGNTLQGQSANGNFETFYDVNITEISFKLDGRAVTYNITAVPVSTQEGLGVKSGRIIKDVTAVGDTVENTINSLIEGINKSQEDLNVDIPNRYKVIYIGEDADIIKNSSTANPVVDADKTKYPALNAVTTDTISESDAIKSTVKGNQRQISFKGGGSTSIHQALQTIVTQSDYIQQAIKNLYTNNSEPDRDTDEYETADYVSNRTLKWINISCEVLNLGYDAKRNDFAYEITYILQSYETPVVNVVTAGTVTPYYGPSKRYDYWLTGKNTEVVKFDLTYNQLYTTIVVNDVPNEQTQPSPIPTMVGQRAAAPRQGRLGVALESQNAYVNYLNDPGAYQKANITILGDPDWLVKDNASSINQVFDRFYGTDGFTINCNSGQVFIEIDFKEAIDYDNQKGVMSVNDKLMFYDFPEIYKTGPNKIQGIPFTVSTVTSNFRSGKFEQTLSCVGVMLADPNTKTESDREGNAGSASTQAGPTTNNPTGTSNKGFVPDKQPATPTSTSSNTTVAPTNTTSPDDDANPTGNSNFAYGA